jgi:hypothetical protein
VIDHVNDCHLLDSLVIVWTVGNEPDAQTAQLCEIGRAGMRFACRVGGDVRDVRIAWTRPVGTWRELQAEVHAVTTQAYEDWAVRASA